MHVLAADQAAWSSRFAGTEGDRFTGLPAYDFAPHYVDVPSGDGETLRVHYVDEGPRDGEVVLLEASGLHSNREAFVRLSQAHLIVLVVEARASTVPVVENALGVSRTAFRKVDGVILNRRRFEVPPHVLRWLRR